jgi:hypothetical protein
MTPLRVASTTSTDSDSIDNACRSSVSMGEPAGESWWVNIVVTTSREPSHDALDLKTGRPRPCISVFLDSDPSSA